MSDRSSSGVVDTKHVNGRRIVSYASADEILADLERLSADGYRQLGNWSLGQIAEHLAQAFLSGLDGSTTSVAWPVRWIASTFIKKGALRGPMKPGFKLPPKFAKNLIAAPSTTDAAGIESMRKAVARWKSEPQRHPHAFFGKLTPDEWTRLMLRHAEMHMSFLLPK